MTGRRAARQTDMTKHGGPITQGSLTVYIGDPDGVACSACSGAEAEGSPVNPLLGAKVLSAEMDLALPGPLSFIVSRDYSSYQTETPAPIGLLGPGWWLPSEVSLVQTDVALTLNDGKGRSIRFNALAPGHASFSRSESFWIVRGGAERLDTNTQTAIARLHDAWMGLHADDRRNPALFFVTNDPRGPWWVFGANDPHSAVEGQRLVLKGLCDRFGRVQRIERNADGAMTAVEDGLGRRYRLELKRLPLAVSDGAQGWGPDNGVRLSAIYIVHDPENQDIPVQPLVRYEYSERGELIAVFARDGSRQRQFEYLPQWLGRMSSHAFAGRPVIRYVYGTNGKVIEQHRSGLTSFRFEYLRDSTVVTDNLGRQRIYHFQGKGGLRRTVRLQHADGSVTQRKFDASGRLVATIDALDRETRFELDVVTGNVLAATAADGSQVQWDYNEHGQVLASYQRPNEANVRVEYDGLGRVAAATNTLGNITRYEYLDERSEHPAVIEDALGGRKHLSWNTQGLLVSYSDCSGSIKRYRYDRWGQLTGTQSEEGVSQANEYDGFGRLVARTNGLGERTTYAHDHAGDLIGVTNPDGSRVKLERDAQGRVLAHFYGGLAQKFEYDAIGRLVRLTNENGAHTTFEHDVMDRVIKQTGVDGRMQLSHFNAAGELVESLDAGRLTQLRYDLMGRLLERTVYRGEEVDPQTPYRQHFQYGSDGLLEKAWHYSEIGNNEIAVHLKRDPLGRIMRETQEIKGPQGDLVWQYSVAHQFNALGVEVQTAYEGLPQIEWQTYGSGHLHGILMDGETLLDFERDKLHREVRRQFGDVQIARTHDGLSRLSSLEVRSPLVGADESLNRLHHYDLAGQLIQIDAVSGEYRYQYDKAGRLVFAAQPSMLAREYKFDAAGNRVFESQAQQVAKDNWDETVRRNLSDKEFNVLGKGTADDADHTELRWMDNRVLDDGHFRYEYDAWGNLSHKYHEQSNEHHCFAYDLDNRLIRYTFESETGVRGANYFYDPFGRRLVKQVQEADQAGQLNGAMETSFFGWDGNRLTMTETGNQRICTLYELGSFDPIARIETIKQAKTQSLAEKIGLITHVELSAAMVEQLQELEQELLQDRLSAQSQQWLELAGVNAAELRSLLDSTTTAADRRVHFYCLDHIGTPLALLDSQGALDWTCESDPWGRALKESAKNGLTQAIRLPGQHLDKESGLHYNRHRYFDSGTGSYTNQDPIEFAGGFNFYTYPSNPVRYIDPLGLEATQKPCAERILEAAEKLNNQEHYKGESDYRGWKGKNKCNLFIDEVLEAAGVAAPKRKRFGLNAGPITAETWANPESKLPGFQVIKHYPKPGDIVAIKYPYGDATGHVAVVKDWKWGTGNTIGAGSATGSHTTGWPWNDAPPQGEPVYFRCVD